MTVGLSDGTADRAVLSVVVTDSNVEGAVVSVRLSVDSAKGDVVNAPRMKLWCLLRFLRVLIKVELCLLEHLMAKQLEQWCQLD